MTDSVAGVIYTDEQGQTWLRTGHCNGCGACCLWDDPSPKNPMFSDEERASQTITGHCPLLRLVDNIYRCAGYGAHEFYLNGCVTFPTRPEDTADCPDCSYSWELIE